MTEHDLKTSPEHFQALWDGLKTAELRRDDRGYAVGDVLLLREWDEETAISVRAYSVSRYTERIIRRTVTHILRGPPWLCDGYVMLSLGKELDL